MASSNIAETKTRENVVDSYFVSQVNEFMTKEAAAINEEDHEGRFFVFQTALQMIINQCPTMAPLLSSIEDCYNQLIELYTDESKTAVGNEAILSRAINCQASIKHQEKRIAALQSHLRDLQKEKDNLEKQLTDVEEKIVERKKLYYPDPPPVEKPMDEIDMKYFMLQSIDENDVATDVETLEKRLAELDNIIETTNKSTGKLWIPITEFHKLEEKSQNLSSTRIELAQNCSALYLRHERLRCAVSALREFVSDKGRVATVGEAIVRTFKTFKPDKKESFIDFLVSLSEQSSNYRGDIGGDDKDTIVAPDVDISLAEWLKKTHKLLSNGNYKEAAETAASAPSGVLCNLATLDAFKAASPEGAEHSESKPPVLFYLEAALGPLTTQYVLSERFLTGCVTVALEYDCFWLISSWIAKRRLPFSANIIKLLLSHGNIRYLPLAETLCRGALYNNLSSEEFARLLLECLIMQNRISAAVLLVRQYKLASEDCTRVFIKHPSPSFLHELVKQSEHGLGSLIAVLEALPNVAKSMNGDDSVKRFQNMNGSELLDDRLVVLLQNEKRQNSETATILHGVSTQLIECNLPNIAHRLIL